MVYSTSKETIALVYKISSPACTIAIGIIIFFLHQLYRSMFGRGTKPFITIFFGAASCVMFYAAVSGRILAVDFIKTEWGWAEVMLGKSPWVKGYIAFMVLVFAFGIDRTDPVVENDR